LLPPVETTGILIYQSEGERHDHEIEAFLTDFCWSAAHGIGQQAKSPSVS